MTRGAGGCPLPVPEGIVRRRLRGLLLAGGAPSPAAVVAQLTAVQAQDHRAARWSLAQRTATTAPASEVDRAFDAGEFLRTHVLRPTWHYVAPRDLRWLLRLSAPRIEAAAAPRWRQLGLDRRSLDHAAEVIAEAVAEGPRTRPELAALLQRRAIAASGERLGLLLLHAEVSGVICSGPMRGAQHTHAALGQRVPPGPGPEGEEALAELARRYFSSRGPATLEDFAWWSGLPLRAARAGLEALRPELQSVTWEERPHWFIDRAGPPGRVPLGQVELVQCYDELVISYRPPRALLEGLLPATDLLRPEAGFSHLLLLDGRLIGRWRMPPRQPGAGVETLLPRSPGEEALRSLERAVARFRRFLEG